MAKFTATVEKAGDGNWTAALIGEHMILGATKEEAIEDLRNAVIGEIAYLKLKGEPPLPEYAIELVSIEVAA